MLARKVSTDRRETTVTSWLDMRRGTREKELQEGVPTTTAARSTQHHRGESTRRSLPLEEEPLLDRESTSLRASFVLQSRIVEVEEEEDRRCGEEEDGIVLRGVQPRRVRQQQLESRQLLRSLATMAGGIRR